jgi:hypothetical protein
VIDTHAEISALGIRPEVARLLVRIRDELRADVLDSTEAAAARYQAMAEESGSQHHLGAAAALSFHAAGLRLRWSQ